MGKTMKWYEVGSKECANILKKEGVKILLAFDNGAILDYWDEHPFAIITHVCEVENPNESHLKSKTND